MTHPIPDEALDDRLGFVGTAGSGKTYNSGGAVERILSRGGRVIIPDPLGVWWGLRLNSTGSAASPYSVVIFGGQHGDLPISEQSGAIIGETVAGMAESAIIDLSGIGTKAGERRFMLAFLTALHNHASREPVHLIFDEADLWAPQRILDREGDAAKLLGQMETIVRRGRIKGFIPWLVTQRPAVLSKDVLSQMDGIVAFKLTGPHDRAALGSWIEGQADKNEAKEIDAKLPTLQRGSGIIWVPGRNVLTTAAFPPKATFDSSRTPKRGEVARTAALQPIDLGKLKDRLATVVAETKANDPKALKARIAELERRPAGADPRALEDAERWGYDRGVADGKRTAVSAFSTLAGNLADTIGRTEAACGDARRLLNSFATFTETQAAAIPARKAAPQRVISAPVPRSNGHDTTMNSAAVKMLAVLDTNPPVKRSWTQVATLAGLKARGGHFNAGRKALIDSGLIAQEGGLVRIVEPSASAGSGAPDPAELVAMWSGSLAGAAPKILRNLFENGPADREQIAARLDMQPRGGHWNAAWKELRDNGIVEMDGSVARLSELFRA